MVINKKQYISQNERNQQYLKCLERDLHLSINYSKEYLENTVIEKVSTHLKSFHKDPLLSNCLKWDNGQKYLKLQNEYILNDSSSSSSSSTLEEEQQANKLSPVDFLTPYL